jgi:exopolysaccharide production protein ExoQ
MLKSFSSFLIDQKHYKESLTLSEMLAIFAIFLIFLTSLNGIYPNTNFFGVDRVKGLNFFNQAIWTFVFMIGLISVVVSKKIKSEFFVVSLPMILLCCFFYISALWSLAPAITIRRSTLELFVVLSIMFSVLNLPRSENAFTIFYKVSQYILLLNLIMLVMPHGFDSEGFFQGVHFQKNYTGLVAAFSIMIGFWRYFDKTNKKNVFTLLFIALWFILLILSQSKTSLGLLFVAPLSLYFLRLINRSIAVSLFIIFSFVFSVCSILTIIGIDLIQLFTKFVDNVGFTGRDHIWHFLMSQIYQRPWLGFGYGGFWDIGPQSPNLVYGTGYVPYIIQAHNGYLDIILNLGLIGLIFFFFLYIHLFIIASKVTTLESYGSIKYCLLFIIFGFMHNFTESSFIRAYSFVWIMQLLSIFIIFKEYVGVNKT